MQEATNQDLGAPNRKRRPRPLVEWYAIIHSHNDGQVPSGVTQTLGPFNGLDQAQDAGDAALAKAELGQWLTLMQKRGPYKLEEQTVTKKVAVLA